MSNIKSINEKPPNEDVVQYLEECLKDAKSGELVQYVLVGRMSGGDRLYSHAGTDSSKFEMLGMLQDAVNRYGAGVSGVEIE